MIGLQVKAGRIERRWTVKELASRTGVTEVTMRKVERGDPTVALGTALEAAVLVGVTLFHDDAARRAAEAGRYVDKLALLPGTVRLRRPPVDDDDF